MGVESVILNAMINGVKITMTPSANAVTKLSFIKEVKDKYGRPAKASYRFSLKTADISTKLLDKYEKFIAYCDGHA